MRQVFRNAEQDALFMRDGAVVVPLLDQQQIQTLLASYWSEVPDLGLGFHATMFLRNVDYRVRVDRLVRSLLEPLLAPLLADYRSVVGNYVVKEHSREKTEVPVHQDWTFVDETVMRSVNVWCPLVDTNALNGQQEIFYGSHWLPTFLRGPFFPSPYVALAPLIDHEYLTEVPLRAGEAVIYDHSVVHGTPPNVTGETRVAVNLALVPAEAPIFHCYRPLDDPGSRTEVFAVDESFFVRNIVGERPAGVTSLGFMDNPIPVVGPEDLARCREFLRAQTSESQRDLQSVPVA